MRVHHSFGGEAYLGVVLILLGLGGEICGDWEKVVLELRTLRGRQCHSLLSRFGLESRVKLG
jgi:hypothetical protein